MGIRKRLSARKQFVNIHRAVAGCVPCVVHMSVRTSGCPVAFHCLWRVTDLLLLGLSNACVVGFITEGPNGIHMYSMLVFDLAGNEKDDSVE